MKVILDTNLLISSVLIRNSIPHKVLQKAQRGCTILCSNTIFNEYSEKLLLSKFDRYASRTCRLNVLNVIEKEALFIDSITEINDCRDPKDNKFLELAIAGKADLIISGDKDLLVLNPYRGVPIITASEFLSDY